MKTIDIIKHHIPEVLVAYGLPPITGGRHYPGECPLCSSKKSFRIDNKDNTGSWICKCNSGDIWKLLIETTGKEFITLAKEIDHLLGNTYSREPIAPRIDYQGRLLTYWKSLIPINGTNTQEYLRGRGIYAVPPRAMKTTGVSGRTAMVCVATNDLGQPLMLHQTFLDGDKKADVRVQKRMDRVDQDRKEEKIYDSIAIRLFDSQTCLGVAEGVETALSAHVLYDCAVWSLMNSGWMEKFIAPVGVEHLIIFADSDRNGTGMAAAFHCGNKNILAKNDVIRVTIRYPEKGDFNDVLLEAQNIGEFKLTR